MIPRQTAADGQPSIPSQAKLEPTALPTQPRGVPAQHAANEAHQREDLPGGRDAELLASALAADDEMHGTLRRLLPHRPRQALLRLPPDCLVTGHTRWPGREFIVAEPPPGLADQNAVVRYPDRLPAVEVLRPEGHGEGGAAQRDHGVILGQRPRPRAGHSQLQPEVAPVDRSHALEHAVVDLHSAIPDRRGGLPAAELHRDRAAAQGRIREDCRLGRRGTALGKADLEPHCLAEANVVVLSEFGMLPAAERSEPRGDRLSLRSGRDIGLAPLTVKPIVPRLPSEPPDAALAEVGECEALLRPVVLPVVDHDVAGRRERLALREPQLNPVYLPRFLPAERKDAVFLLFPIGERRDVKPHGQPS